MNWKPGFFFFNRRKKGILIILSITCDKVQKAIVALDASRSERVVGFKDFPYDESPGRLQPAGPKIQTTEERHCQGPENTLSFTTRIRQRKILSGDGSEPIPCMSARSTYILKYTSFAPVPTILMLNIIIFLISAIASANDRKTLDDFRSIT